jgi:hypothetical protein
VVKHRNGQSDMGPVMDGGTGCEAAPEQMRIDALAERVEGPLADKPIEPVLAKRLTTSAEPEPTGRLGVTEEWAVVSNLPVDARHAPVRQDGKMRATRLGLLGRDV